MNVTDAPISTSLSALGYSKLTVNAASVVGEAVGKAAVGGTRVDLEAGAPGAPHAANTVKHTHNHPVLNMIIQSDYLPLMELSAPRLDLQDSGKLTLIRAAEPVSDWTGIRRFSIIKEEPSTHWELAYSRPDITLLLRLHQVH
jgi:hypothetical protein